MKNFINYAKNRFLYGLLKLLIIIGLGLIASQFLFIPKVYAEEVDFSTQYYWSNSTDVTYTTDFRSGTNNFITLYGKESYAPTYDEYEYITGFDNYISYSVSNGTTYTVKVIWTASSVSSDVFVPTFIDNRLSGLTYVAGVNGIITYQKTTYTKNNCFSYQSTEYCNYNFITTYTFNATTNATAFRVGTYNRSAYSFYGSGNYLTQIVSVNSIDVIVNADNTIINQNEQIIDQNQTIIDNSSQTNEKLDETNDNLNDLNDNMTNEDYDTPDFSELEMADDTPISDLVLMPINYLNKLVSAFSNECRTYTIDFGIFKSNYKLSFPCIKAEKWLGSTLWNIIDVFACFFMIYEIGMLAVSAFNDFTSLRDTYDSLYTPKHGKPLGKHTSEVE